VSDEPVRRRDAAVADFRDIDFCSMTLLANLKASGAVQIVRYADQLDEILSCSLGATFYSHELAGQLGISVRTLHNAVVAIRGRPLHDYIRLRRLWRVHQTLVSGAPVQIKSVALANGFWHPGEFSQSYRALFGEAPSQTLCRARGE
jgi:transcriptional regulator GlxA family with amidase domain